MKQIYLLVAGQVALALLACNASGDRVPSALSPLPNATGEPSSESVAQSAQLRHSPVEVRVNGPDQIGSSTDITVQVLIDRIAKDPLSLRVVLPPGASIISGAREEQITGGSGHIERTLVLHLANGVPPDDVRVIVDAGGPDYGVHATAAYRFGRPEPKLPQPARTGKSVVVNGRNLGTPIPLK